MAARRRKLVAALVAAAALGLLTASFFSRTRPLPEPRRLAEANAVDASRPVPVAAPADPATSEERIAPLGPAVSPSENPPAEDGDLAAWRTAKFAFTFRELGALGPYVKVGLDGARRDMAFCFDEANASGGPSTDPAVLLLYLEGREGALDVVEARTERLGDATPQLVECCRQVLRGLEIPAFNVTPGQRVRIRFRLD